MTWIGHFHPLAVHLPIGLLLLVGLFEVLGFSPRFRSRTDPAVGIVLRLGLVGVVAALALGLVLASEGGYPPRLVAIHRALAFGVAGGALVCTILWALQLAGKIPRIIYRVLLLATLVALGLGAHFGGSITHGPGYLSPKQPAPPVPIAANSEAFDHVLLPVFQQKCVRCHGAETAKGELRLDNFEAFTKEKPGDISDRIKAPVADDSHMPPEGKPQLTPAELQRIELGLSLLTAK